MARTAFKGNNLLVSIGLLGADAPTATYATSSRTTGGLKTITAINDEPTTLIYVPTGRSSELNKTKSSERIKFLAGEDLGEIFEMDEAVTGNMSVVLCRDNANEAYYDPAIDILLSAAHESNADIYVKFQTYIGYDMAVGVAKHCYHVKATVCKVKLNSSPNQADAKMVERQFDLEGNGEWIEGYFLV